MNSNLEPKSLKIILTALAIGCVGFFGFALILLRPFFSGQLDLPQSFNIGPLGIHYYGLILGLAVLGSYWLISRRRIKYQISQNESDKIVLLMIIFGFVGARLYHVLSELPYYLNRPSEIIAVWHGGLSIFGAVLVGIPFIYFYNKYFSSEPKPFLSLLDWLAPGVVLGQIIGRFGNFLNYELYGYPTQLPWKMFVPAQYRLAPFELNQFFHPLFLYESAGNLVILYILLRLNLKPGRLFLLWLLLYNVLRFFLEYLRIGSIIYSGIRINALMSLAIAAASAYYLFKLNKEKLPQ